jgi:hypothetical protein
MYRVPSSGSYRYQCKLYQQSHGKECAHNHIIGPTAARFVLAFLRQFLLAPGILDQLKQRLQEFASRGSTTDQSSSGVAEKKQAHAQLKADLTTMTRNMALANTKEQFDAMSRVFDDTDRTRAAIQEEITAAERQTPIHNDTAEGEVEKALSLLDRLPELVGDGADSHAAHEIIKIVDTRLYLRFRPTIVGKRTLNKLVGGVVTAGSVEPPVKLYEGPTSRRKLANSAISGSPTKSVRRVPR